MNQKINPQKQNQRKNPAKKNQKKNPAKKSQVKKNQAKIQTKKVLRIQIQNLNLKIQAARSLRAMMMLGLKTILQIVQVRKDLM